MPMGRKFARRSTMSSLRCVTIVRRWWAPVIPILSMEHVSPHVQCGDFGRRLAPVRRSSPWRQRSATSSWASPNARSSAANCRWSNCSTPITSAYPIEPRRFRPRPLCDWADAHWRPLFDRIVIADHPEINVVSGRHERLSADAYHRMFAYADRRYRTL